VTIRELREFGVTLTCEQDYEVHDYYLLLPIPLTPELLEKCGFVKGERTWYHPATMLIELFNTAKLEGNFHIIAGKKRRSVFEAMSKRLEYLHQLQNIFFATTGEELKVNI
jgi:hypothetical protein